MSTASSTKSSTKSNASLSSLLLAGATGGAIATILNLVIFYLGQAAIGGPLSITMAGAATSEPLEWFMVVLFSILPGVVAGAAYWGFRRLTASPRRWFLVLAGVVFVGFFFGPFNVTSDAGTILVLELMHVGAAVPIIWSLFRADERGAARA